MVEFARARPFRLQGPQWHPITAKDLRVLVGQAVEEDRGAGYVPRVPEPEPEPVFEVVAVADLAVPRPFREPGCMPSRRPAPAAGALRWRRRAPAATRAPGPAVDGSCCWYHGGDWRLVCALAVELVAEGKRDGVPAAQLAQLADARARELGLTRWQHQALLSLVSVPVAVSATAAGYTNGQHRVQAMRDAGVTSTVTLRYPWPPAD